MLYNIKIAIKPPDCTSKAVTTSPSSQTIRSLNSFHYGLRIMFSVTCYKVFDSLKTFSSLGRGLDGSMKWCPVFTLLLLTELCTERWSVHRHTPTSPFKMQKLLNKEGQKVLTWVSQVLINQNNVSDCTMEILILCIKLGLWS